MVAKNRTLDYSSVPTAVDVENNSNQKKYTVNRGPKGSCVITRLAAVLMALGVILLIGLAVLATYLLLPKCADAAPEAVADTSTRDRLTHNPESRLPASLTPLHYQLKMIPFLEEGNFTTNGVVAITLEAQEDIDRIVFNLKDIEIDKHSVKVKALENEQIYKIRDYKYDDDGQIYMILLEDDLKKDKKYEVEMKFAGRLSDNMQGFYRSHYMDTVTNKTKWLATTQFSPTDARRAFPCFDEPSFKSKFTISIARPVNMSSLSNMPKRETIPFEGKTDWVWDNYMETPLMSTYLVAFIVSDLHPFKYNTSDKLFTVWSRLDAIQQTQFAINIGPELLKFYEKYFEIDYSLPKIDLVAIPDFGFSAMENWGLLTFRETALLFDDWSSTVDNKRNIALIIAHELAHQWFGNLVTPRFWNDLWLKEGFATYLEYLALDRVQSQWKILDEFIVTVTNVAFKMDSLESAHPIANNVENSYDVREMFNDISYSKGAAIIRMMNHFLGEESFKRALKKYLTKHQYSNAQHDDLWKAFTEQAQSDGILDTNTTVKEIMDTWTLQSGYPVITANANYEMRSVHVSQKRFLFTKNGKENKSVWWVPISYTTAQSPNFQDTKPRFWLKNDTEGTFEINTDSWWLLNLQQTGYYIVNYDEKNWRALISNLMNFPPVIRAQLIGDSMDLAKANLLDYDIPLKLITSVGVYDKDISYVPILAAFDKLDFLYNVLSTTSAFGEFDVFLSSVFNYAFDKVGLDDSPTDSYITQKIRRAVLDWACRKRDSRCVATSRHLFRAWMTQQNQHPIPPNVRKVVYCTAIREGGEAEWDFALQKYTTSSQPAERETILDALGCSSRHWILSRYLELMLQNTSVIRKQDGPRIFHAVASNTMGNALAFDFLRKHWIKLNEHYGVAFNSIARMVEDLPTYINTPYQLTQLENFKKEAINDIGAAEQAFDNSIEKARINVAWMKHSFESVKKWLHDRNNHFGYNK